MLKVITERVPGEPHCRRGNWSAVYEGGFYVWHGSWKKESLGLGNHVYGGDEDATSIFRLDMLSLKWEKLSLKEDKGIDSNHTLYSLSCGSSTQHYNHVYTFGGHSMTGWYGTDPFCHTVYQVDLESLKISRLEQKGQIPQSRDKTVLFFYKDALYLLGGWSRKPKAVQPGAKFVSHETYPILGWNNEFYRYDLVTTEWTYQPLKGEIPPPTAASSLTRVGDKVYLVAGRNPPARVDDVYTLDLVTMEWRHLAKPPPPSPDVPWPAPRSSHAVSPIYLTGGSQTPHLVLFGGLAPDDTAYSDVWVLNLTCMQWQQQMLQSNSATKPVVPGRTWFGMGCTLNLWTSCFELCIFGGVEGSLMDDKIGELADTQVLELGMSSLKRLSSVAIIDNFSILNPILETLPTVLRDNLRTLQSVRECNFPLFSVLSRFSPFKCFPNVSHLEKKE